MKDRETAGFWNTPTGIMRMVAQLLVAEAVEGGMVEDRADELYEELTTHIEKQDGGICGCGTCTNELTMDDVAENFLDRVRILLSRCPHDNEWTSQPDHPAGDREPAGISVAWHRIVVSMFVPPHYQRRTGQ